MTARSSGCKTGHRPLPATAAVALGAWLVAAAPVVGRTAVFLSDIHLGPGCSEDGCHPMEDARWPDAWQGFLSHLGREFGEGVDLVILGDLLELWQHPETCCDDGGPNDGCTPGQVGEIVGRAVAAHEAELTALARFAATGSNRVHVVPGNHDAGLLLDEGWEALAVALGAPVKEGRIVRVDCGRWVSADGRIAAEHGHQIGHDVNRFDRWPTVTRTGGEGAIYLERTWGERFIQKLYNDVETAYPAIDNFAPTSEGVVLYMAAQGPLADARDVAKLVLFNLFETSWRQKVDLGADGEEDWNLDKARGLGHRLVAASLEPGDPMREGLLSGEDGSWGPVRAELDRLLEEEMTDDEVGELCDRTHTVGLSFPEKAVTTCQTRLGKALLSKLMGRRPFRRYLAQLHDDLPDLAAFVYGHTHRAETPHNVRLKRRGEIQVANTGAFQRLASRERLAADREDRLELADVRLEELAPCYTFVMADGGDLELLNWHQPEGGEAGRVLPACDPACAPLPEGCD